MGGPASTLITRPTVPIPSRLLRLALLLLLVASGRAGAALPLDRVTLQLRWDHQFQFAGYYAALEKGFYREVGLEVTLVPSPPGKDPIEPVLRGSAQFGVGGTDLLLLRNQGKPVVVLAAIFQHSPVALLAPTHRGIRNVADLADRPVMLEPGSTELLAFLKRQHLESRYQAVPHNHSTADLLSGKADAMSVYVSDEPYDLHQAGIPYLLFRPFSAGIDFYGDNLFTTAEQVAEHPERVRAFRAASLRGWAYAMAHEEEIARLIHDRYSARHSIEHLLFEAEQMRNLVNVELVEPGYMHESRWRRIADTYAELGMLPPGMPLQGFLYNAVTEVDTSLIYGTGAAMLTLFAFGAGVAVHILRLNRRLRASEERYRVVNDHAPLAFVVWDRARRVTAWNRQAERMFGWRRDEVLGRDILEFMVPEESREVVEAGVARLLAGQAELQSLNWNVTRGGQRILCEWMNAGLHDENGQLETVVALALDVTDRKRLEDQLRASEENHRRLLERAPFPIIVTRLEDGAVTFVNLHAEQRFGVTRAQGRNARAVDFWVDPAARARMVEELSAKGGIRDFEAQLRDKMGIPFWVLLSASVTDFNNERCAFVSFNEISERKRMEEALRASEERFRLLAENAYDVIWTMDLSARMTYVSPSVQRLRGVPAAEAIGQRLTDIVAPGSLALATEGFQHLLRYGDVSNHQWELELIRRDGSTVWTEIIVNPMRDSEGHVTGLIGITRDVDEQRRIREALRSRMVAIEAAAESVVVTDAGAVIEYVNPAFSRMTGYAREEVIGRTPAILKSGMQPRDFYQRMWREIRAGEVWRGEVVNRRKDGSLYSESMAIAPVKDEAGNIVQYVAIKHDISERKELESRLERMAHFDPLTALPNRALFFDRLDRALAEARRYGNSVALLFVDLDGFKGVNDGLGHAAGDQLLQAVAERFRGCVRQADTVARVGGDEFTVILTRLTESRDAAVVAEKLLRSLEPVFELGGQSFQIGASIGISLCPEDACDAAELLRHSDDAMYEVKRRGKNTFVFYSQVSPLT